MEAGYSVVARTTLVLRVLSSNVTASPSRKVSTLTKAGLVQLAVVSTSQLLPQDCWCAFHTRFALLPVTFNLIWPVVL